MLKSSSVSFVAQDREGMTHIAPVVSSVQTFTSACNSVVLSAAAYIAWKYPTLQHPWYPNFDLSKLPTPEATHESANLSLHPLFEGWCDIICQAILEGDAVRQNDELFVVIRVPFAFLAQLENLGVEKLASTVEARVDRIYNLSEVKMSSKKIALMNFATSQLREDQLQPKINILSLLLGVLFDNQKFSYFRILRGEVPSKEQLVQFDSIIMPGSSYSAMDSVPEIDLFVSELKQALEENKNLKVLSICFGHQVISRMFDAIITRKVRFEGQENVRFVPEVASKYDFLESLSQFSNQEWMMPEHHQDYVETVPEEFDLLGYSQSCAVEAMIKKDGRILCFQFHPEYLSDYAEAFENRLMKSQPEYKLSFDLSVPEDKKKEHLAACTGVRLCMKKFLA